MGMIELIYLQLTELMNGPACIWYYRFTSDKRIALFSITLSLLYPRHLCRGVYSFRLSVRPFVCSFVRSFVLPSRSWNYFKVLRASNSSGVYLTNHSLESIHIWTIGTLEGRLSFHDSSPQGPCPGVGLEFKIYDTFKKCFSTFLLWNQLTQIVGGTWLNLETWTCGS